MDFSKLDQTAYWGLDDMRYGLRLQLSPNITRAVELGLLMRAWSRTSDRGLLHAFAQVFEDA